MSSPRPISLPASTVQLEVEVKRAQRYGRTLSVALIALDGLRDRAGEAASDAGEAVLGAVSRAIAGCVRGSDLACRTGGVEFAVLFVETGAEQAARATRRVIAGLDEVDAAGIRRLAPAAAIAELAPHEGPRRCSSALGTRSSRCAARGATGSPSRRRRRSAGPRRPGGWESSGARPRVCRS
jgi:GGDEF domain-containing protein